MQCIYSRAHCGGTNGKNVNTEDAVKYLGDWFNASGNNKDLIAERKQKALCKLVSIFAIVDEVASGAFQLQALLLMYKILLHSNNLI